MGRATVQGVVVDGGEQALREEIIRAFGLVPNLKANVDSVRARLVRDMEPGGRTEQTLRGILDL